jgi:outer membrane lipoprotein-sorting protein
MPQLLPVLDAVRATLAGDRAGLERIFAVQFGGDAARWTLELEPASAALARAVSRIDVDGAGADLLHVEILYADGDRSRMTLRNSTAPP